MFLSQKEYLERERAKKERGRKGVREGDREILEGGRSEKGSETHVL